MQEDPPVQDSEEDKDKAAQPAADAERDNSIKANKRLTGTVKWFNVKAGFGFITRHDNGEDVFVHQSCIMRPNTRHNIPSVGEGEVVEFGLMASKVTGPGFKRVKGSAFVRPRRFGRGSGGGGSNGRPGSGSSVRSKRGERRDSNKNDQESKDNQPIGDGPIVKDMAQLKLEDKEEEDNENPPTELSESVDPLAVGEGCIKEEPKDDEDDDDDTISEGSTSTVATAESAD